MKNNSTQLNKFFLDKFINYGLHIGSLKTLWNPTMNPYLSSFRNDFCIVNPYLTFIYLRRAVKFLIRIIKNKKKILFIGAPITLEKEFFLLSLNHNHFFIEKIFYGFFTNIQKNKDIKTKSFIKKNKLPDLIVIFNLSENSNAIKEISKLDIPTMAFVNSDEIIATIDYPIPANIKSQKGDLFVYNMFYHLFSFQQKLN